jgi:hypothetical protein
VLKTASKAVDEKSSSETKIDNQFDMWRHNNIDDYRETMTLGELPRVLRAMTGKRAPYQRIYRMVVDGDLPAEKNLKGKWVVRRKDIPAVARIMNLISEAE